MNRFIELQQSLSGGTKKKKATSKPKPSDKTRAQSLTRRGYAASLGAAIFDTPAYTYQMPGTEEPASAQSWFGNAFTKGAYYDWPDKMGIGDAAYDEQAAAWIAANRSAITDFAGLKKTSSFIGGYSYNGTPSKDPAPDWKEPDAAKLKVYDAIRKELFTEGGANSINTYDNQIVTLGWGFSAKYNQGKNVIRYNMESDAGFKNAMLEIGINARNDDIFYVDTTGKKILNKEDALQKIRWDVKVLSRFITALDGIAQTNVNNQARIFKESRMKGVPTELFSWPTDSVRLAVHLSHWLPAYLKWAEVKSSGGNVGTIIKSFCKAFHAKDADGFKNDLEFSTLTNGALYVKDVRTRLDMGNKALIKAGDAGTVKRIDLSAFTDNYKTEATYANYCFVELSGKVYLIP